MIGAAALATGGTANAAASPYHQPAAVAGHPAPAIQASTPQDDRSTVTFTPAFTQTLKSAGIGLAPTGGAQAATAQHQTAVTMLTRADARDKSFLLSGGIKLTKGKSSLALTRWDVDLDTATTTAAINHRAPAAVFHLGPSPRPALGQARIELNQRSAAALNAAFGTRRFRDGATLGYFSQPQLLGSGSGYNDVAKITIYNLSRYNLTLSSINNHNNGGTWTTSPQATLTAGQQETATYGTNSANGADVTVSYLIDGTSHIINGEFAIPPIGRNWPSCTSDDFVTQIACTAGWGWNPASFQWTIGTNEVTGPFFDMGPAGTAWQFHRLDAPNLRLQVYGADRNKDQILDIESKNGQPNQNWAWYPDAAGDGWGQLRNANSQLCMDEAPDGVVIQWDCIDGAANELWKPVYDPGANGASDGSALQVKSSQKYLTTNGTTSGTAQAELTPTLNRASGWGDNRP